MKPYFEEDGITIYHGDCREILPQLPRVDAMITDPPYGINLGKSNNQARDDNHLGKRAYASYDDSYENFVYLIVPRLRECIAAADRCAIWSGPNLQEQSKAAAIGGVYHPGAQGRNGWGTKNFLPVLFYGSPKLPGRHRPTVIRSVVSPRHTEHPCEKPIEWMKWLVGLSTDEGDTILDPFMGAGTTLLAAKDLGRHAIGIEIEEKYCEIAARRLSQGVLPLAAA